MESLLSVDRDTASLYQPDKDSTVLQLKRRDQQLRAIPNEYSLSFLIYYNV